MEVTLTNSYKSLSPFSTNLFSDFIVVVGLNGSGKTQLLELFNQMKPDPAKVHNGLLKTIPAMRRVHSESVELTKIDPIAPNGTRDHLSNLFFHYQNEILSRQAFKKIWDAIAVKNLTLKDFTEIPTSNQTLPTSLIQVLNSDRYQFTRLELAQLGGSLSNQGEQSIRPPLDIRLLRQVLDYIKRSFTSYEIAMLVAAHFKKDIYGLTQSDFLNAVLPERLFDAKDLIGSRVEVIFYNYLRKRSLNHYQFYKKNEYKEVNNSVSPEDFDRIHPAPWDLINNILDKTGMNYQFRGIDNSSFSLDAQIEFELIKKSSGKKIPANALSSGERIILGLILKLFTTRFYNSDLSFPDMICLDEPDAHLHPRMSQLLISILHETFVKDLGIKVLITTHSPSTVALAPSDCIYQISNDPSTSLTQVDKDEALRTLMFGVPNLSIDYKNHRQIFVESPTDLQYYQSLYNKLKVEAVLPYPLYFISNGYGQGNCEQVIKLVGDLRRSGNKSSFGIIDWDKNNTSRYISTESNRIF